MATWKSLKKGSTAGNISMDIEYGIASVTRTSNTNVKVVYGIRFKQSGSSYTYNNVAAFCPSGGTRYYAFGGNGSSHTSSGTWYYANKTSVSTTTSACTPFTKNITVTTTQTSASFKVGYGWNAFTPSEQGTSTITVTFPSGATKPTGLSCSVTSKTETTVSLSGKYTSNGGASVTATGFQYSTNGTNWTNCSSSVTGLAANTTYYFRYYATNNQGTAYSSNTSITTHAYPYITSTPEFTIGDTLKIDIYNPLSRECTINLISDDNVEHTGDTITTTSISGFNTDDWKNIWYNSLPNKMSGTYKVRLICSTGNVDQTSNPVKYSCNINDTGFKPIFTTDDIINITNTENVSISGSNKFIKNHNSLSGTIKPMSAQRGANGNYYNISSSGLSNVTVNDVNANVNFTLGNMNSNIFYVTAVDSRGFSTTINKTIDLINYEEPSLTRVSILRQNGVGTKAIVHLEGTYTDWTGLLQTNSIQNIKYKVGSSGSLQTLPNDSVLVSSNGIWTLDAVLNDDFSVTSQYNIYFEISDLLETSSYGPYILSTADAFIWKDLANKRLGINKKPDCTLDVEGSIKSDSNIEALGDIKGNALYVDGVKMFWYTDS